GARGRIMDLVKDFPSIWTDPQTPALERKRMVALLIEDVTLIKADVVTLHVRFRGGECTASRSHAPSLLPASARPYPRWSRQ
ncbi:MAG: hypothetical protein ACREXY_08680, partial [Gammaproteobacteria bacterium]